MKRVALLLCALAACSGNPPAPAPTRAPVSFRAISEKQNPTFCVEEADFEVAMNEDQWIDVFDRETECQPEREIDLPDVDFASEVAVAAWWKVENCLGFTVKTESVERIGADVVVTAAEQGPPPGSCAQARGALESFLIVSRDAFAGARAVRFVLDGKDVGREPLG